MYEMKNAWNLMNRSDSAEQKIGERQGTIETIQNVTEKKENQNQNKKKPGINKL